MVNSNKFLMDLLAKMSQRQSIQNLREFLTSKQNETIQRPNLFNSKVPENVQFSGLFDKPAGLLSTREQRDLLLRIMTNHGVSVERGNGNVVFSPEFSSQIDLIVSEFIQQIETQSSPSNETSTVRPQAGGGAGCKKVSEKSSKEEASAASQVSEIKLITESGVEAVKGCSKKPKAGCATAGGGGAVCHERPKTLADFQKESEKKKPIPPKMPLTCVVCQHTTASGTCQFKHCQNFHPFNPTSVVVKQHDNGDKKFLVAKVCPHFSTGSCKHENSCNFAHLSREEFEKVVAKNKAYEQNKKKEDSKVSPQEKRTKQPSIVPSQVLFGRPSSSSASPASPPPVESQFSTGIDPFMFAGLTAVSDGLSGSVFDDFDPLTEWSNFMVGGGMASEAGSPPPRSYSPAVEVLDSEDDKQGD